MSSFNKKINNSSITSNSQKRFNMQVYGNTISVNSNKFWTSNRNNTLFKSDQSPVRNQLSLRK